MRKYRNKMNSFENGLRRYLTDDYLERAAHVTIGIAGCGGIGSNTAQNLVRCGFKRFLLVDHDSLEASNLNRQFFFPHQIGQKKVEMLKANLLAINPDLSIRTVSVEVTQDNVKRIFAGCHVLVEGFDDPLLKKTLVESVLASHARSIDMVRKDEKRDDKNKPGKNKTSQPLLVAVSGIAGTGNTDAILTRKIRDNFYMVGDFQSEISDTLHPYAPGIAVAAAKQADVVFNTILMKDSKYGCKA